MHGKYITMSISLSVMYIQNNMVLHFQFSFESSSYRNNPFALIILKPLLRHSSEIEPNTSAG